jgi:hypothetical protein
MCHFYETGLIKQIFIIPIIITITIIGANGTILKSFRKHLNNYAKARNQGTPKKQPH